MLVAVPGRGPQEVRAHPAGMCETGTPAGHQLDYWENHTRLGGIRVYVLRAGEHPAIKVGMARNVRGRVATLQTGNPFGLRILHSIPGDRELEASLHQEMAADRLRGEWFDGPSVEPTLAFIMELGEWLKSEFEASTNRFLPDWRDFDAPRHERVKGGFVKVTRVDPSLLSMNEKLDEIRHRDQMRNALRRARRNRDSPWNPEADAA